MFNSLYYWLFDRFKYWVWPNPLGCDNCFPGYKSCLMITHVTYFTVMIRCSAIMKAKCLVLEEEANCTFNVKNVYHLWPHCFLMSLIFALKAWLVDRNATNAIFTSALVTPWPFIQEPHPSFQTTITLDIAKHNMGKSVEVLQWNSVAICSVC